MNKITMLDESEQNMDNITMQEISGMGIKQSEDTSEEELISLMSAFKQKSDGTLSEQERLFQEKEQLEREKEERLRAKELEEENRRRYEEEQAAIRERQERERREEEERLAAEQAKREASLSYKIKQGLSAAKGADLTGVGKVFFLAKRVAIFLVIFGIYNFTSIMTASYIIGRLSK